MAAAHFAPNSMMMPSLAVGDLAKASGNAWHHLAGDRQVVRKRSGRLAIAAALQASGIGAGDEVLVPAYHCPSMVTPVSAVGATPRFYRITPDLQPDNSDVRRLLTKKVKAVLAVHFYGVLAQLAEIRQICDNASLVLIEDCAHCFSYCSEDGEFDTVGDFLITSPRKFLPTFDGGELVLGYDSAVDKSEPSFDFRYHMKILKNTLETAWSGRRVRPKMLEQMAQSATQFKTAGPETPYAPVWHSPNQAFDGTGEYSDPRFDFDKASDTESLSGRLLRRILAIREVALRRQRNYQILRAFFADTKGARLLIDNYRRYETPYVLPLYFDAGDRAYSRLLQVGIPMWRWDELYESDCKLSREYGHRVIQLPCHQNLTPTQMETLGRAVTSALSLSAG